MAVVEELIRKESDGNISFGNHLLAEKAKRRILSMMEISTK